MSPIPPKGSQKRANHVVVVIAPPKRTGTVRELVNQLLQQFDEVLRQSWVREFVQACDATRDEKSKRAYLAALSCVFQWTEPREGRHAPKARSEVSRAREGVAALGVWNAEAWISVNGRLGPLPRLLLLIKLVCGDLPGDEELTAAVAAALGEGTHTRAAANVVARVRQLLQGSNRNPRVASAYSTADPEWRALLAAFNELSFRDRLPVLRYSDLMEVELGGLVGRETLGEFESWLRAGLSRPRHSVDMGQRVTSLGPEVMPARVESLAKIVVAEMTEASPVHSIVQWPCGTQPAMGITIARACVDEIKRQAEWRVIWLCASRTDRPFFRVSTHEFLRPLAEAFQVMLPDKGPQWTADDIGRVVEVLRKGLSRYKCLVIVEGLRNAGGRIGPLLDFLSGSSVFEEIIRGLATPPVSDACDRAWDGAFAASRFLLLPARAMRGIHDLSDGAAGRCAWSDAAIGVVEVSRSLPDETCRLAKQTLAAQRRFEPEAWPESQPGSRPTVQGLVEGLAQRSPHNLIVLCLIASVPDGVLIGTLRRVFRRWRVLIQRIVPREEFDRCGELLGKAATEIDNLYLQMRKVRDSHLGKDLDAADALADSKLYGRFGGLLSIELQDSDEYLGPRQLRWEVEKDLEQWDLDFIRHEDDAAWGQFKPVLVFRNANVRDVLIEAVCRRLSFSPDDPRAFALTRIGWGLMQLAAAGECMRQATALLRNADPHGADSPDRFRRLVQALHHVSAAGALKGIELGDARNEEIDHQTLLFPAEHYRRRAFTYSVLYRQLVERDEWWLTRATGRSELRVGLLLQALYPGRHPRSTETQYPPTAMETDASQADDASHHALDKLVKNARVKRENSLGTVQGHEPLLQAEFFQNLLLAASDAEDHELAKRCLEIVKELVKQPSGTVANSKRGSGVSGELRAPVRRTLKLEYDILDAGGTDSEDAARICLAALKLVDKDGLWVYKLKLLAEYLFDISQQGGDPFRAPGALRELRDGWLALIHSADELAFAADMMARWADVLSNEADRIQDGCPTKVAPSKSADKTGEPTSDNELAKFFVAWTAFWLANALRAEVGMHLDRHGKRWGRVSSRAYRTGIRTTLKLARLLALPPRRADDVASGSGYRLAPSSASRWLLEYARSRADILTRDVHLYERERIQSLLMQSSIARTVVNIGRDLSGGDEALPNDNSALVDALQYVASAERRLIDLGSPRPIALRWIVERLNVLGLWLTQTARARVAVRKLAARGGGSSADLATDPERRIARLTLDVDRLATAVVHDMSVLHQLAEGSAFWMHLYRRAARRYLSLRNQFGADGVEWPSPH
ncbi:hypothetical protein [Ideonella sp. A 288]|uniref:hypothetical protein n=1 Tax=Ideonella sp. A 288 TaxID=1962181 RepID=UPI0013036717|nr:hypothetical protein [Ideonella sp. A 288]